MCRVFGVTGGIGSGKSTVSRILQNKYDYEIIDADLLTRRVHEDAGVCEALALAFGERVAPRVEMMGTRRVDRKALGCVVFSQPGYVNALNQIMHPVLEEYLCVEVENARQKGRDRVVIDAALLYEAGWSHFVERVVAVVAPQPVRIARVMQRDGLPPAQVHARMVAQISAGEMSRRADDVLYNVADIGALERQVLNWVLRIGAGTA